MTVMQGAMPAPVDAGTARTGTMQPGALLQLPQRERVLTVTLNPALDVSTGADHVRVREKLRCDPPRTEPGGGGINVSRAMKILGGDSTAFVVLGGPTGQALLAGLRVEGIEPHVLACEGDTRMSIHVMDRALGAQYRFVMPGPRQSVHAGARLLDEVMACATEGHYGLVVASGSLLPGLPDDWFAALALRLRPAGIRLIVDTSGPALLAALAGRPFLLKPDTHEWTALASGRPGLNTPDALADALLAQQAAEIVILTLAAEGALLAFGAHRQRIRPPKVAVRSEVGAGDSFIGALALGLARGWPIDEATRFGVVAAASAVTTEASELCRRDQVEAFFVDSAAR